MARIYALNPRELTEEQIAVTFAMTSRSPEPFDETARQVTETRAAGFHEKWVVGYGHASVAEHAVLHLAAEGISRIAADALEDGRLASYTEKSSRYQVIPPEDFHTPRDLSPGLKKRHQETCRLLFRTYYAMLGETMERLKAQRPDETELTRRRAAADACRAILPAATLTNVGLTANARSLERAITKLMSSPLSELQRLGEALKREGRRIAPTLVKYAGPSPWEQARQAASRTPPQEPVQAGARLISHDPDAELKLAAALLYRKGGADYDEARRQAERMTMEERAARIAHSMAEADDHAPPPREFETVQWQFELTLDYGALRELRRHRMLTILSQPPAAGLGMRIPHLLAEAGLETRCRRAAAEAEELHQAILEECPAAAGYAITHGHLQRVMITANLRELWHLFRLRTSPQAHESLRAPMLQALELARRAHPALFHGIRLRR